MSLVGKEAPAFRAQAVVDGNEMVDGFSLDRYRGKNYVIFFFYQADFGFVCPTELLAFQDAAAEFERRDAVLVACSVDSQKSHYRYLQMEPFQGGIKGVKYPIVADHAKTIAHNYGVLGGDYMYNELGEMDFEGLPVAYRGLFLIDKGGIVRHEEINDMPLGRNVEEVLRLLDALRQYEEHGDLCPANWKRGGRTLKGNYESVNDYLPEREILGLSQE